MGLICKYQAFFCSFAKIMEIKTTTSPTVRNRKKAIVFMLMASLSFAFMGAFAKELGHKFNSVEIVFFRNFFGSVVLLTAIFFRPLQNKGSNLNLLIFRGLIGTFGLYCFSYTLTHMTMGEAFTYFQTSSFFIAFLSYFFLKETLNKWGWLAIFIGFVGIVVCFRPDIEFLKFSNLLGIMNGLFSALAYMSVSALNQLYDRRAIVLSFMLSGTVVSALSMTIGYYYPIPSLSAIVAAPIMPNWSDAFYILGIGSFAVLGQYFVTIAYSNEKSGIVSVVSYSNIIFSIALGVMLHDPWPDFMSIIGIVLIIISGSIIAFVKDI